jgi:hypothetical protein
MPQPCRYLDWNNAICERFYNVLNKDAPVFLQIDDEVISEIGSKLGITRNPVERFSESVTNQIQSANKSKFGWFDMVGSNWKHQPMVFTYPPYVGLLALTVLAASHMTAQDGLSPAGYYVHLQELFGFKLLEDGKKILDDFWRKLDCWLMEDRNGALGISTIHTHPKFHHIGYPLSQIFLRQADIERFSDFFNWANLPTVEAPDSYFLTNQFIEWTTLTTCTLGNHFFNFVNGDFFDEEMLANLGSLLSRHYQVWRDQQDAMRGSPSMERADRRSGPRGKAIDLRVDENGGQFEFMLICEADEKLGLRDGEQFEQGGIGVEFSAEAGWLVGEIASDQFENIFENGYEAKIGSTHYRFTPAPLQILGRDDQWSGWVTRSSLSYGEVHALLVHSSIAGDVETFLTTYADKGWSWDEITSDIRIYSDICIPFREQLSVPNETLAILIPKAQISVRMEGGIKVDRRTWLSGHEPLAVVHAPRNSGLTVVIDGMKHSETTKQDFSIQLFELELPGGRHIFQVGTKMIEFFTDDLSDTAHFNPDQAGGYVIGGAGAAYHNSLQGVSVGNWPVIRGADICNAQQQVVRINPQMKKAVVLGQNPGEVLIIPLPYRPGETEDFIVLVPFVPQWLIQIGQKRRYLRLVGSPEVKRGQSVRRGLRNWRYWVSRTFENLKHKTRTFEHEDLWNEYRHLA